MSSIEELEAMAIICVLSSREERKRKRAIWAKDWLQRKKFSDINLLKELKLYPKDWKNYLRMEFETYGELLKMVFPYITKQDTVMREAITPHEKLTATLRYLATGRTLEDMKFSTRISPQALGKLIPDTCLAIAKALKDYCKVPKSEGEWKKVAEGFEVKWNFPNCLGAMDGKHIAITPPPGSGSFFYNYKGFHSQVLFAIANANYEILYFNFGCNGRVSDGGVFEMLDFNTALESGRLNVPKEGIVGGVNIPYVFIADDAFPLRENIMKPFNSKVTDKTRRIYNYRLSRGRRMVESIFGILAERFGVFQKPISFINLDKVQSVVVACCYLHNYLRSKIPDEYSPSDWLDNEDIESGNFTAGPRMDPSKNLEPGANRSTSQKAKAVREKFVSYFNNEGAVPWQERFLH